MQGVGAASDARGLVPGHGLGVNLGILYLPKRPCRVKQWR